MPLNIGEDVDRFKDIVRNKIKHHLGKYVSSDKLIGQQGNKKITIPINSIDLPRFTYGNMGGGGMGDGDIGDAVGDGDGSPGSGKGKAGNEHTEPSFDVEFTPEDLAKMLGEELQLPNIQDKGSDKIPSTDTRYTGIRKIGPESLKSVRRTYKEALKRSISSGSYNPENPVVVPIREDKRYRSPDVIEEPSINTAVIYMMDVSGSMEGEQKHIVKSEIFWIDLWLRYQYKGLVSRFIIHDTEAREVTREQFFNVSIMGGTAISSAYKYCAELMEKEYPFSAWNVYPFHFSDGDNWDEMDSISSSNILRERILPNCNMFSYGQVESPNGSGLFIKHLMSEFSSKDNINLSQIENRDQILASIKTFFNKGK